MSDVCTCSGTDAYWDPVSFTCCMFKILNLYSFKKKFFTFILNTKVTYSVGDQSCSATHFCKPNLNLACTNNICKCSLANTYWHSPSLSCRKLFFVNK